VKGTQNVQRDGMWFLLGLGGDLVDVPQEVYLREFRDTPAADLDALQQLCSLGKIRPLGSHDEHYGDLPIIDRGVWNEVLRDTSSGLFGQPWHDGDGSEREAVWRRNPRFFPVHAAEVALRVRAVQRATDHVLAYRAGEPVAPVWRNCTDEVSAWRQFTDITGAALRDFRVRVEVDTGRRPAEEFTIGAVYPTLYSVAVLQLVNDLAEGLPVIHCANETCRRPFVRQRGRAKYRDNRTRGVMYCSNTCARAQYQREKRRRDRNLAQNRKGGQGG
jgi:hypothetical protein